MLTPKTKNMKKFICKYQKTEIINKKVVRVGTPIRITFEAKDILEADLKAMELLKEKYKKTIYGFVIDSVHQKRFRWL